MGVGRSIVCTLLWLVATQVFAISPPPEISDLAVADIQDWYTKSVDIAPQVSRPGFRLVHSSGRIEGAVFYTHQVKPIPAYSGKPIAVLVAIDTNARIVGLRIVQHEEPILVIGVKPADLDHFTQQFSGLWAFDNVRINAFDRDGYKGIDGISGATITAMVLNRTIMSSVQAVANTMHWPADEVKGNEIVLESGSDRWSDQWWLWSEKWPTVVAMGLALGVLLAILFFQDWLVKRPKVYRTLRLGYLLYTLVFIGYIFTAQLSIVNILAFIQTFNAGFTWETLLLDPALFLLWSFVAMSMIFWGRGVFCGWLCPFGALQELIHKLSARFDFPTLHIPGPVHERLWTIKYFILIGLIGISLDSFERAAAVAEVEPFKTVFVLTFVRDWPYVIYALGLLAVSAFNSKFYCKYLCALGAGLSILGRIQIFDWLRRRNDCGRPCQACATICPNGAIKNTGEIIAHECHYCLECQVAYWDRKLCPSRVRQRRRAVQDELNSEEPKTIQIV